MICKLCCHKIEGEKIAFQGAYICRRCAEMVWEITTTTALQTCEGYHDYR